MKEYVFNMKDFHEGNNDAFRWIYDKFFVSLYWIALKLHVPQDQAEDIVVEKMLYLYEHRKRYKDLQEIKSIVYQSVRFSSYNYQKWLKVRQRNKYELIWYLNDWSLFSNEHEDNEEVKERTKIVIRLLDDIPTQWKEMLYLAYYKGYTNEQIGKLVSRNKMTVAKHVKLAIKYMAAKIKGESVDIEELIPREGNRRITLAIAHEIKRELDNGGRVLELARIYNIDKDTVSRLKHNKLKLEKWG